MAKIKFDAWRELTKFWDDNIPDYVDKVNKNLYTIKASTWEGGEAGLVKITPENLIEYYHTEARNITSGVRTLAGFSGDWRQVDGMAKEALEWFKLVNRPALVREGKKYGMTLR